MPNILIVDSCKPSLVMTSEIFKDRISGTIIRIAKTGKEALEKLAEEKPDMCVVDFDLPDADGITLIALMRKTFSGPILLTAYPDPVVKAAVEADLFAQNDSGAYVRKPIRFDDLADKIERFILDKHRIGKRFDLDLEMDTMVIGKGAGRGKRAPKVTGQIINVSLGGVCVAIDEMMKLKKDEEMTVLMALPSAPAAKSRTKTAVKAKPKKKSKKAVDTKIKCQVCWVDRKNLQVGLKFNRLTDVQKRGVEALLRDNY
jgi:CheY-like chemotaxis protein